MATEYFFASTEETLHTVSWKSCLLLKIMFLCYYMFVFALMYLLIGASNQALHACSCTISVMKRIDLAMGERPPTRCITSS